MQKNINIRQKISIRPISYPKELFLAIALISGEVSPQTVWEMKKDFGVSTISRAVIYNLVHQKLIEKVKHNSGYGYVLTPYGAAYLEAKAPDKYNYDFFSPLRAGKTYKEKSYERNRAMSMVLYQLVQNGVSITDHYDQMRILLNGHNTEINQPFFVTAKEMRSVSVRLAGRFSSRSYGCIITKENIIVVYYPDKDHHLWLNSETDWRDRLVDITRFPNSHFKPRDVEALYLFDDVENAKDSYDAKVDKANIHSAFTRRCYKDVKYFKSHTLLLNSPVSQLGDIINQEKRNKIDEEFMNTFQIEPCAPTIEAIFADGIFENDEYGRMFTALLWDLNPRKIVEIMENIREKSRQVLVLCFEEQMPIIQEIFSVNKRVASKVRYGCLPYAEVMAAVEYDPQAEALVG